MRILREAGITRPALRKVFRDGTRILARVDMLLADRLVVEFDGDATHSGRRQRQIDAQRRTELTLRGYQILAFTFEDVRDRPQWVVAQIRAALTLLAAV